MISKPMERYKAEKIDSAWFVWDTKHPEIAPVEQPDEFAAKTSAFIWNLLTERHL